MAYENASDFLLKVATTSGGVYANVKGVTSFDKSADVQDTEVKVFGETDPLTFTSKNARTFEGSGVRDSADTTGQNVIAAAYESGDTIYIQDLPDGAAGTQYPVRVTAFAEQKSADDNVQRYSFSLKQNGVSSVVP